MLYVFIDESGDLGFTEKSTKYYVIGSVETKNLLALSRVIKRTRKTLRKKQKNIPEFKFARSDDIIRKRLLKKVVEGDVAFSAIVLQKYSGDKKANLYNYLAGFIAESLNEYDENELAIIVDKFIMSEEKRKEFNRYLERKLHNCVQGSTPKITIAHENSQRHPGLQVADFVAGAVFQYYEHGRKEYYEIIKPKLRLELRKLF